MIKGKYLRGKKIGLGTNQRRALELLKENKQMTIRELATAIYGKSVQLTDHEYAATAATMRLLKKRGLVNQTTPEIRWSLKNQNIHPKGDKSKNDNHNTIQTKTKR